MGLSLFCCRIVRTCSFNACRSSYSSLKQSCLHSVYIIPLRAGSGFMWTMVLMRWLSEPEMNGRRRIGGQKRGFKEHHGYKSCLHDRREYYWRQPQNPLPAMRTFVVVKELFVYNKQDTTCLLVRCQQVYYQTLDRMRLGVPLKYF